MIMAFVMVYRDVGTQEDEETYTRLVHAGDVDGVMELLTNREVEKRVLAVRMTCRREKAWN